MELKPCPLANYIDREEAAKAFSELLLSPYADDESGPFSAGAKDALKLARDMMLDKVPDTLSIPSADVVEVVRCKDCRWHEQEQPGMVYCPNIVGGWMENECFCSMGEQK